MRMDRRIRPISAVRLSAPLQNFCIGLAIIAVVTIICYFWLDQPLAFFLHRNVADKTILVWLQQLPVTFPLLSSFVLAWCGLWTLMDRLAHSVGRVDMQYKFHFDQSHKSPTQVRVWPNLAEYLDRK
jgi:hypothetical protein